MKPKCAIASTKKPKSKLVLTAGVNIFKHQTISTYDHASGHSND
ncbi:hypothetical protein [Aerosakkonema sp. BLCC-F183]